jgi:hypothetical protein
VACRRVVYWGDKTKNLPGIDINCSELFASIYASIRSKLLLAAIELKSK